jgi:hypothetical protein
MPTKKITVVDANGHERKKGLGSNEGYNKILAEFEVAFLKDGDGVEIEDFEYLVDGGKYTLPTKKITLDGRTKVLSSEEGFRGLLQRRHVLCLMDESGDDIEDFESLVDGGNYRLGPSEQPPPQGISWTEVAPLALKKDTALFEREEAARVLWHVLVTKSGTLKTPVLDQCYGAGKTSLVWKFRSIFSEDNSVEARKLQKAVYLAVRFQSSHSLPSADADDEQFELQAESIICRLLFDTLKLSSNNAFASTVDGPPSTMTELLDLIPKGNGVSFLFHIDEVGIFETKCDEERGQKMLYCIWIAAEQLRHHHHYFVLSGRSRLLHFIGKQFNHLSSFQSPNQTVLIPLNNLSSESIKAMFEAEGCKEWVSEGGNLEAIRIITGGMPRAVNDAVEFVVANNNPKPTDSRLQSYLKNSCPLLFQEHDDASFRHLVELSWAGIEVNLDDIYDGQEPLSALLARFGLNTSRAPQQGQRHIEVPLYLLRSQRWATGSLCNLVNYSEPGDRLESGFRRVLFLRLSVLEAANWSGIGLHYLETAGVPFLPKHIEVTDIFNFPKISDSARGNVTTAKRFMDVAHQKWTEDTVVDPDRTVQSPRQTFNSSFLKDLSDMMLIGQYYLPLPRSSSADAMMRVGEKTMLDFQFKNFMNPISVPDMEAEANLCAIDGWTVFLVIFCTAGHEANGGCDFACIFKGVTIIALSRESVSKFLGPRFVDGLQSAGLASDQAKRLSTCTSPLKRKYQSVRE